MRKIIFTAALIICVMLTVSCASTQKDMDEQYKNLYDANNSRSWKKQSQRQQQKKHEKLP